MVAIRADLAAVAKPSRMLAPYDDTVGDDEYLYYKYRGTDPQHPDNVGLRRAMQLHIPIVYFYGSVPSTECECPRIRTL